MRCLRGSGSKIRFGRKTKAAEVSIALWATKCYFSTITDKLSFFYIHNADGLKSTDWRLAVLAPKMPIAILDPIWAFVMSVFVDKGFMKLHAIVNWLFQITQQNSGAHTDCLCTNICCPVVKCFMSQQNQFLHKIREETVHVLRYNTITFP